MPRYVILEHDHPELHWDFMLEAGDVLRTWRLSEPPLNASTIRALASFDHRRIYLDYEGPVSGNRGNVLRWDGGTYEGDPALADRVEVCVSGARLHGVVVLQRDASGAWSFQLQADSD